MFNGVYAGIVTSNADPLNLQRVQARVPTVHGPSAPGSNLRVIADAEIPWALPMGMPNGGSPDSGGVVMLPNPGDQVFVMFLDGMPENPVWIWGNQNTSQRKSFPFATYGAQNASPARAFVTKFGNLVELNQSGALVASKSGYAVFCTEGSDGTPTGQVGMQSAAGYTAIIDDTGKVIGIISPHFTAILTDATFTVDSFIVQASSSVDLEGDDLVVTTTAKEVDTVASGPVSIAGNTVKITGTGSLTVAVGASSITLSAAGITLSGPVVNVT